MKDSVTGRPAVAATLALLAASCTSPGPGESAAAGVVDDVGRIHAVHTPRTRVISLIPAVTETLVEIGAADRLVARTRYDEQAELAALPILSGVLEPSAEALVDLEPDLVIMWPTGGDGGPVGTRLVQVGLHWYGAAINTVADFERHAANFGKLLGLEDRADSVVAAVQRELVQASESWSDRQVAEIFYVVQKDPPMTVGPDTFLDSIFSAAGAVNAFRDVEGSWPSISLEQIIWRDPDYVIVPVEGYGTPRIPGGTPDPSAGGMAALFGWAELPAVAAGRVISVDASLFGRPGPRMGEAARYLAYRIHGVGEMAPAPAEPAAGAQAARGQDPRGIRAAMHPRWTAPPTRPNCRVDVTECNVLFTNIVLKATLFVASRTNSPAIRLSKRLANAAPRHSRCSRGFIHGLQERRGPPAQAPGR